MAVYRRGKRGIWYVRFMLRGHRVHEPIPEARTKAQAQQVETLLRQQIFDNKYNRRSGTTDFAEFVRDTYLPWAKANKRSWRHDEFRAEALCDFFAGKTLGEITPSLIEQFKERRRNTVTQRGRKYTAASVNRELQLLSKIFSMAEADDLVEVNPCRKVRKLKEPGKRERYLTHEEEGRLMAQLVDERAFLRPIVVVALNTGLRRRELLSLRWEHINLGDRTVFVTAEGRSHIVRPGWLLVPRTKAGKPLSIPMNEAVRTELLSLRRFAGKDEYVFRSPRTGGHLVEVRASLKAACADAGIPYGQDVPNGITFHTLRDTFATRLKEQVDPFTLKELMGHAAITMTAGYAHATPEGMTRAVGLLDRPTAQDAELKDAELKKEAS